MIVRKTSLLILLLGIVFNLSAQHKIEFAPSNYESDTLIIGYYILDKQLVQDTLYKNDKGTFELEDTLSPGVYLTLTFPDMNFLQFLVNDFEKEFRMNFDYIEKSKVSFEGSHDNACFQSYVDFINQQRPAADSLKMLIGQMKEKSQDVSLLEAELEMINKSVLMMQDSLIEANPDFMSTMLLKANKEMELPEFDNTEEGRLAQYRYYKDHYFDFIDLSDTNTLYTPFLFHRLTYYVDKLTPRHPDSVIISLDYIFNSMGTEGMNLQYYLSHFLNLYAQSKIVGMDKVYVHLAEEYYAKGKAPWATEETVSKILDRAAKLKPVLIGKTGQDIKVFGEDGTPISISEIDYEYLVLLFWAPDCGHCKKSMPGFVEFAEKYKDKNIKVFAICTKYREKVEGCWDYVKEKDMLGFINGADEFNRSDFKLKYFVNTTPKVYILDKNREILMKNVGADQLDAVFESIFKQKEQERLQEK